MYTGVLSNHRRRLIAGATVLAVGGAVSGQALALSPYTVHVSVVPSVVTKSHDFRITAAGRSSNASILTVFIDPHKCALTAKVEVTRPKAVKIISQTVVHHYTKTRVGTATVVGAHHVCAYLTAVPPQPSLLLQYARATAPYTVVPAP